MVGQLKAEPFFYRKLVNRKYFKNWNHKRTPLLSMLLYLRQRDNRKITLGTQWFV